MRRIIKALSAAALAAVIGIGVSELPVVGDIGVGLVKDVGAVTTFNGGNLTDDLILDDNIVLDETITIPQGSNVTIDLNSHTINGNGNIVIDNYGILTITDSSLGFNGIITGGSVGVYNHYNAQLDFEKGVIIGNTSNAENTAENTAGVMNAGAFNLSGGIIAGNICKYGGVYVTSSGIITMTGGKICNNRVNNQSANLGNVNIMSGGIFEMSGGTICDNDNIISVDGGKFTCGVNNAGTFEMSGSAVIKSFELTNLHGAGVHNTGTFTMSGGQITKCSANNGGGVFNTDNGTFTMSGGSIVENAASVNGGGVHNYGGTFKMSDNAQIIKNKADDNGGGVYNNGIFDMNGGSITENTANSDGGGVYLKADMNVSGAPVIKSNKSDEGNASNVYIDNTASHKVIITGALTSGADIHVTPYGTIKTAKKNYKDRYKIAEQASDVSGNYSKYFTVDGADAFVSVGKLKEDGYYQIVKYAVSYEWEDEETCTVTMNGQTIPESDYSITDGKLSGSYVSGEFLLDSEYITSETKFKPNDVTDPDGDVSRRLVNLKYSVVLPDEYNQKEDAHISKIGFEITYDSKDYNRYKDGFKTGSAEYELTLGVGKEMLIIVTPYYEVTYGNTTEIFKGKSETI